MNSKGLLLTSSFSLIHQLVRMFHSADNKSKGYWFSIMEKILINDTTALLPILLLLFLLSSSCSERKHQEEKNVYAAHITFDDSIYDFGAFSSDIPMQQYVFRFINEGDVPAVILNVDPSCQCISVVYTQEVIQPGKSGMVGITFDGTQSDLGYFDKSVRVRFNSSHFYILRIKGCMK